MTSVNWRTRNVVSWYDQIQTQRILGIFEVDGAVNWYQDVIRRGNCFMLSAFGLKHCIISRALVGKLYHCMGV